jgi:hypothetical protein
MILISNFGTLLYYVAILGLISILEGGSPWFLGVEEFVGAVVVHVSD